MDARLGPRAGPDRHERRGVPVVAGNYVAENAAANEGGALNAAQGASPRLVGDFIGQNRDNAGTGKGLPPACAEITACSKEAIMKFLKEQGVLDLAER